MSIETILTFAVGFLTAALIGLLILKAVAGRARRLERRNLEAMRPSSLIALESEVAAERARAAQEARRLERDIEQRRAREGEARLIADRVTTRLRIAESELTDARQTIADLEDRLVGETTRATSTEGALARAQDDVRRIEEALYETRRLADERELELSRARDEMQGLRTTLALHADTHSGDSGEEHGEDSENTLLDAMRSSLDAYRAELKRLSGERDSLKAALEAAGETIDTPSRDPGDTTGVIEALNTVSLAVTARALADPEKGEALRQMIQSAEGETPLLQGLKALAAPAGEKPKASAGKRRSTRTRTAKPASASRRAGKAANGRSDKETPDNADEAQASERPHLPKAASDDLKVL
ncbi:MAG: hypothetical protein KDI98_08030 [Hyphomicrobiaceae bacterium]|nr:hypothetical protein [Hyphomicrobiaceae bacterium]